MVVICNSSVQIVRGEWQSERSPGGDRQRGRSRRALGLSVPRQEIQNAPARHKATQAHEIICLLTWFFISCLRLNRSWLGLGVFLTDYILHPLGRSQVTTQRLPPKGRRLMQKLVDRRLDLHIGKRRPWFIKIWIYHLPLCPFTLRWFGKSMRLKTRSF